MQHAFQIGEDEHDLGLSRSAHAYRLHVGDRSLDIDLQPGEEGGWVLHTGTDIDHVAVAVDGDTVHVHLDGETYALEFRHALDRLAQALAGASEDSIKASMPGSIISLDVAEGDTVETGQTLLVMESMKMETTIVAPRDGVVETLHVGAGQTFDKDALLVTMQSEGEDKE